VRRSQCQLHGQSSASLAPQEAHFPSAHELGSVWDNAVTETLFGSLKVGLLHGEKFITVRAAKDALMNWILWHNQKRLHSTIGYQSPVEFELAQQL
jgi:transposase InsO family protein